MSTRAFLFALGAMSIFVAARGVQAAVIADSFDEWSVTGTQGENSWFNGYRNFTLDGGGDYVTDNFIPFLNDGSGGATPVSQAGPNQWTAAGTYDFGDGAPWTFLGAEDAHPNGTNSAPNEEHWVVRRWVADVASPTELTLQSHLRATNLNGPGTSIQLYQNGVLLDTLATASGAGLTNSVVSMVSPGDIIDLALTPVSAGGDRADGSDGSAFRLTISDDPPPPPVVVLADSIAGFSGTQGQNNFFYGYYDAVADVTSGDGVYGAGDFIPMLNDGSNTVSADTEIGGWKSSPNHWDGTKFDLLNNSTAGHGPWTEMSATGGHPAANGQADPEVHWAVRRWVSDSDQSVVIKGELSNGSASGDGTVGRIFVDGVEIYSQVTNGNVFTFEVPAELQAGSVVDFAIDPDGAGVLNPSDPATLLSIQDGSDGTSFSFQIQAVPEPGSVLLLAMGMTSLLALRRRRG